MSGWIQGENGNLDTKIWRKISQSVGRKYREALRTISQVKMRSARFRRRTKRAAKSLRSKRLFSQGCEVGFHLEILSFQLVAYIGQLQEEIHHTVQKGCEITSQQKGDFATLLQNAFFSLKWSTCSGCNFFVSTPNCAPFKVLDFWLPELWNGI